MKCLDDHTVVALLDGRLTPDERSPIHDHVDGCCDCRARIANFARAAAEIAMVRELNEAAHAWQQHGRDPDALLRGRALSDALRLRELGGERLDKVSQHFLSASERNHQRSVTRRRAFVGGALALLFAAVAVLSYQITRSSQQQRAAEQRVQEVDRQRAEALRDGARAALEQGHWLESRAKLRNALEVEDSAEARGLWWRLDRSPMWWRRQLGGLVYDAAFSPDGKMVAAACQDEAVYLFDAETTEPRLLRGHGDQVLSVDFSPDGRLLASSSWDGRIILWDTKSWQPLAKLEEHQGGVRALRFSPDGSHLASGSRDGKVILWSVAERAVDKRLAGHEGGVWSVAFSPDGQSLATAGDDLTARVWSLLTGRPTHVLRGHNKSLRSVVFSPDGTRIVSAGVDRQIIVWDPIVGFELRRISGHGAEVRQLAFSPDGTRLVSVGRNARVVVWSFASGELARDLSGHTSAVHSARFSPDGHQLLTAGRDRALVMWDLRTRVEQHAVAGHDDGLRRARFSPDGKEIATASLDGSVRIWNVATGQVAHVLQGHTAAVLGVDYSPAGDTIVSSSNDNTIRLWDAASGAARRVFAANTREGSHVRFSPDGKLLASASGDATVRILDPATGLASVELLSHEATVWDIAFRSDGAQLASCGNDRTIRLWDSKTGEQLTTLTGHEDTVYGAVYSHDGNELFSSSGDGTVRAWPRNGSKGGINEGSRVLAKLPTRAYWMSLHPDGKRLGVAAADGMVRVLSIADGRITSFEGHRDEVNDVTFSDDGRLAASTSDDHTVRLWDLDEGRPFWRAPALLTRPVRLLTHHGWRALDGATDPAPKRSEWRTALERRAAEAAVSGDLLCLRTNQGGVELWSMKGDRLLHQHATRVEQVVAVTNGCVARSASGAALFRLDGSKLELPLDAPPVAMASVAGKTPMILVAVGDALHAFDAEGYAVTTLQIGSGVSAVGKVGERFAVGYHDGNMTLFASDARTPPTSRFEQTPSSAVVSIVEGPKSTLIAGYASGTVGIWFATNGAALMHRRLHGPVRHLLLNNDMLYAATELGQHLVWDLRVFSRRYCDLLQSIWNTVAVTWRDGRAHHAPIPDGHPCRER